MSEITMSPKGWERGASANRLKLIAPSHVEGLFDEELGLLAELCDTWVRYSERNATLTAYYEAKEPLKDFGLTMPKSITENYTPLGWARKAVDMLMELCVFEGFVAPGMDDPFGLQDFMASIGFTSVLQQAIQTALIHGCSFLTVGRAADGQPTIRTHTAEASAAIWGYPNRRIKACMSICDQDKHGNATGLMLYMPERNILIEKHDGEWAIPADATPEPTVDGRCMAFRLAYKPTQIKPLGRSRISRDAMRIIDGANRTICRAEGNAEFYSFPKILLLGTSDDIASMSSDKALGLYMGRWNAISKDIDGDSPSVVQLSASTMDPHLTMLKSWAAMFAAAVNIPASSLGVVSDSNPTSAEATEAQREDLIIEARHADRDFGDSILETIRMAVRMRDPSVDEAELLKLQVDWMNRACRRRA